MNKAAIPYGAYWSSPFARWQGVLANLHSLKFAAHVARTTLEAKAIPLSAFDYGVLGFTVPQEHCFYGMPWLAGEMGAERLSGPTVMQACATSARVLAEAHSAVRLGDAQCVLTVTTDRVSNGPHVYYPNPAAPGGTGATEDWVLGNFERDPYAGCNMVTTAENCARRWNVSTGEQHAVVLRRYEQYLDALANDRSFQRRYMSLPFEVPDPRLRKTAVILDGDEGVTASTAAGLAKLKPVVDGGTVTYGGQTFPADGCAGVVVTTPDRAAELATDPAIRITIESFGQARTDKAWMPAAPLEAAARALESAGVEPGELDAIKSHNPFAVNDIIFARETGVDLMSMNNYGCSLIWGHPQGPTGMRAIIELIEELALRGGGTGLFHGCAAGDSAMAVVVRVD